MREIDHRSWRPRRTFCHAALLMLTALAVAACSGEMEPPEAPSAKQETPAEPSGPVVEPGSMVSIEYSLFMVDGSQADTNVGREPITFRHGASTMLPKLEDALLGLQVGENVRVTLPPEDAYGHLQDDAVREVPLDEIPEEARQVGAVLIADDNAGKRKQVRVQEVTEDHIVLDLNHPLAGKTLTFEVKIVGLD